MATYCTATDVSNFMQRSAFSGSTVPTSTVVESFIDSNEEFIEGHTQHAWKPVIVTEEYLNPTISQAGLGIRFDLQHRKIRTLSSGTDKIEVWDGTQFLDYVANKTEGFRDDFFVDYTNGVIWIRDRNAVAPNGVRFTYRYGDSTVNKQIKKACILLTARDILIQSDDTATFVDDGPSNRLNHDNRVERWESEAMKILDSLREIKTL